MAYPKQPIWKLVQLCAQELTKSGVTPFTRADLVRCVQNKNPRLEANSINPIIQGVTDNLSGGAPGAVGKEILHSVGRGQFELKDDNTGHIESPASVTRGPDSKPRVREARQPNTPDGALVHPSNAATVRIGKCDFRYICAIVPKRDAGGSVREFMPQARYDNAARLPLNKYGDGPFCKFTIPPNIAGSGVYAIAVNGQVRYIGQCTRLSSRFNTGYGNISPRNCFVGGQETNCRINNLVLQQVKAGLDISLWFFATDQYETIERELRGSLPLVWNRV